MAPARQTTPTTAVRSSNFFFYIYTYVHVNILLLNTEERSSDGWNHHKLIPPNVMARAAKATAAEKNRKVEVLFFFSFSLSVSISLHKLYFQSLAGQLQH